MLGWKKIAALFALTTSAGLLGAACAGQGEETADAPEAVDAVASPAVEPLHGPSFARRQCENSCLDRFNRCARGPSSNLGCRRDRDRCLESCRRF